MDSRSKCSNIICRMSVRVGRLLFRSGGKRSYSAIHSAPIVYDMYQRCMSLPSAQCELTCSLCTNDIDDLRHMPVITVTQGCLAKDKRFRAPGGSRIMPSPPLILLAQC
ncbi:hypothetical protein M514_00430 [Trichuris suis]|uniref:Uncharacterized protein n=1 Tax=Trichuris suis TaxID=68888 RepID=A0A085MNE1_9BILA|nr:hypothetical protein M513_00430 [Trichuris suis]KFD72018.1 hypothetical protein M514_00430 [Trichuris suis]KHJ44121.1 hypothetical protein D918_05815 [Trichuris suis]